MADTQDNKDEMEQKVAGAQEEKKINDEAKDASYKAEQKSAE